VSDEVLELAEKAWRGEVPAQNLTSITGRLSQIADGLAFVHSFANVTAFDTDDGLVLVDTGSPMFARAVHDAIREWTGSPLHIAIYTHGHIDHTFGVPLFEEEVSDGGTPAPRVVAHAGVPRRFDRYRLTAGYNTVINRRQFGVRDFEWPTEFRYPDETYHRRLDLEVGGVGFELHHAKGETDDHTWVWIPSRKVLCTGDFFVWVSPNAGNPQKVQRYPKDWAIALREMAQLGAEILLPGHGPPILGASRIVQALNETAEMLESLHDQTLSGMNRGARLDEIIRSVRAPAHLLERPFLTPIYDEPEFVVRSVWRLYGGWFDGNPASLKPPAEAEAAGEIAALAGGAHRLSDRALELAGQGRLRLAGHLAELAALAAPEDSGVHAVRAKVYRMRVSEEQSTMARGIFSWAASESENRVEGERG